MRVYGRCRALPCLLAGLSASSHLPPLLTRSLDSNHERGGLGFNGGFGRASGKLIGLAPLSAFPPALHHQLLMPPPPPRILPSHPPCGSMSQVGGGGKAVAPPPTRRLQEAADARRPPPTSLLRSSSGRRRYSDQNPAAGPVAHLADAPTMTKISPCSSSARRPSSMVQSIAPMSTLQTLEAICWKNGREMSDIKNMEVAGLQDSLKDACTVNHGALCLGHMATTMSALIRTGENDVTFNSLSLFTIVSSAESFVVISAKQLMGNYMFLSRYVTCGLACTH